MIIFNPVAISLAISLCFFFLISFFYLTFNTNSIETLFRFDFFGFPLYLDGLNTSFLMLLFFLLPSLILIVSLDSSARNPQPASTLYGLLTPKGVFNAGALRLFLLLSLFLLLFFLFLVQDLFFFYLSFEWLVFPLFFVLLLFGSHYPFLLSRFDASFRLLLYTFFGGLLLFFALLLLLFYFGSSNTEILSFLISHSLNPGSDPSLSLLGFLSFVWLLLLFSFFIKVPVFPFHTWLPLAHSEAPTFGSIILAAIILKLASFGLIKFNLFLFPTFFSSSSSSSGGFIDSFFPFLSLLLLFSLFFASFTPLRSLFDLKKLIAYSSIVHMNFSLFGLFSQDFSGLLGGSLLIFSHALTSSALFFLVGFLYSKFHTRLLPYFQGLSHLSPLFSSFFFLFSLSNLSLPFTFSFLPEFFILNSSLLFNPFFTSFLLLSLLLSSSFFFYFTCKLLFGPLSSFLNPLPFFLSSSPHGPPLKHSTLNNFDLSKLDFFILLPFLFFTFLFAFFPTPLISLLSLPLLLISSS